jgi:hypothetical protein
VNVMEHPFGWGWGWGQGQKCARTSVAACMQAKCWARTERNTGDFRTKKEPSAKAWPVMNASRVNQTALWKFCESQGIQKIRLSPSLSETTYCDRQVIRNTERGFQPNMRVKVLNIFNVQIFIKIKRE